MKQGWRERKVTILEGLGEAGFSLVQVIPQTYPQLSTFINASFYLPSVSRRWMEGWICLFPHSLSTYGVLSPRQYK